MLRFLLLTGSALVPLALAAQQADQPYMLEEIILEGASYETEGTGSYGTDLISVGEKEALDPRLIPQSTTVVTHTRIQDADYTALDTAMVKTPGMMVLTNDAGRSSVYSRGFELDFLYYDGLPAPLSSIYGTQPDMSIIDHVEVLRGPSGLFIGAGEPAGSVNMRLKQAGDVAGGSIEASANSFGRGRVQADITGPLDAEGRLRGRAVLAYEDGDGALEMQRNGVTSAYGTLAYDLTPETTLTFSVAHMQRRIDPFNGLPTYADGSLLWIDRRATTAAPWNDFSNRTTDVIASVEHRLDSGGFVKAGLRWARRDADFLYAYSASPAAADNTITGLAWLGREFTEKSLAFDAFASLPVAAVGGNLIVGVDAQRIEARTDTARGRIAGRFDLDNWDVSGVARPDVSYNQSQLDEVSRWGIYTQLRAQPMAGLTVVGGARLSWYDGRVSNPMTGAVNSDQSLRGRLTPYLGVTYDLNDNWTVYASHTAMFQPQTQLDENGSAIAPREGHQTEIGLKADYGGLYATAALFDLRDRNRAVQVPGDSFYTAGEQVRARGLEMEIAGEIAPDWQIVAGYTYTDTAYLSGPSAGQVFSAYTPEHMLKLWAEYDPQDGALAPWSFGAGVTAMSSFSSVVRGTEIRAPGYAVVDASAAYAVNDMTEIRLNVNNLLDRDYYSRVGSTSLFNFRGEGRNATLKLVRRF